MECKKWSFSHSQFKTLAKSENCAGHFSLKLSQKVLVLKLRMGVFIKAITVGCVETVVYNKQFLKKYFQFKRKTTYHEQNDSFMAIDFFSEKRQGRSRIDKFVYNFLGFGKNLTAEMNNIKVK